MKKLESKKFPAFAASLLFFSIVTTISAGEKIIQQETISFQKCLEVIKTSENKLSIAATTMNLSDQERVAIFTLTDGILKIICDGIENKITVTTDTD